VDDQVQALDLDVEELAVPASTRDLLAVQLGPRRADGLQHGQRRDVHPRDGATDTVLADVLGERLHLG
jgi:hypothetical protein